MAEPIVIIYRQIAYSMRAERKRQQVGRILCIVIAIAVLGALIGNVQQSAGGF